MATRGVTLLLCALTLLRPTPREAAVAYMHPWGSFVVGGQVVGAIAVALLYKVIQREFLTCYVAPWDASPVLRVRVVARARVTAVVQHCNTHHLTR